MKIKSWMRGKWFAHLLGLSGSKIGGSGGVGCLFPFALRKVLMLILRSQEKELHI